MRVRLVAVLIASAALLAAPYPSAAQEQTGRAEGTARDQHAGVLPGVTVQARSLTVGSVLETVTDLRGEFRFAALSPGEYDLTASLAGFRTQRFERVEILLGQTKRLDFTVELGGVQEQVNVSAQSPLVDVKKSARAVSLRQDQLAYLPRGWERSTT